MTLKIIDLIAFSLGFAKETIFLCFSRFFLIIYLNFLIHAVIAQIFIPLQTSQYDHVMKQGQTLKDIHWQHKQKQKNAQRNLKPYAFFMLFTN